MTESLARKVLAELAQRSGGIGDAELDEFLGHAGAGRHRVHDPRLGRWRVRQRSPDHAVLGVMNGKAGIHDGRYGYFYLERV